MHLKRSALDKINTPIIRCISIERPVPMLLHAEQVTESFMTSHQSVSREATYPAAMGYPRNQWYVAAFSREVQSGSPLRRVLLDTPVLLYRTEAGQPVALYDRCPHRGAPLSNGKQIGDDIQCGYHGISYGRDGRCTHVPSQPGTPAAMSVSRSEEEHTSELQSLMRISYAVFCLKKKNNQKLNHINTKLQ